MAAGPITAIQLLHVRAAGARRIRLSTLGLLQFIVPTLHLLIGIWMFHEPFGGPRMWGFAIIWAALALYSAEGCCATGGSNRKPQRLHMPPQRTDCQPPWMCLRGAR
jgi:chloramphenicol-sensitive protein RarD